MTKHNQDYEKALQKINDLEEKYGDVVHVPESNQELKDIRTLLNGPYVRESIDLNLPEYVQDEIEDLLIYGYEYHHIASQTHVDYYRVPQVARNRGVKKRRIFHYRLEKENKPHIYASSIRAIGWILNFGYRKWDDVVAIASRYDYFIRECDYLWGELPDHSLYMLDNPVLYEKMGNDSFEKVEAKIRIPLKETVDKKFN